MDSKDVAHIFRAYDVRGVFNQDLTVDIAANIGTAFGSYIGPKNRVSLGWDCRSSSEALANAISAGMASAGVDVTCLGAMPIPVANFTTLSGKYDYGTYITASHNPPEYNGVRFRHSDGTGFTVQNDEVRDLFLQPKKWKRASWNKLGKIEWANTEAVIAKYCNFLFDKCQAEGPMKIVVDPMHGAGALTARRTMEALGHKVESVSENIDATFGGRDPHPRAGTLGLLEQKVKSVKADFGVAFDPDGDRVVFVDDKGRTVQVEVMGIILAREVLRTRPGGLVLANIPCSMIIEREIEKVGGKVKRTRVGDVFVCEAVKKLKAVFGMEISAHFFIPTYYIFDDPLLASLMLAQVLSRDGVKLSKLIDDIPTYPTIETGYEAPDKVKFKVVDSIRDDFKKDGAKVDTTDGVKVIFDDGWAMLRPSNTQPMVRLFAEAKNEARLGELVKMFERIFKDKLKGFTRKK
jgi:phosphomannomutase/phosphoglucomutase